MSGDRLAAGGRAARPPAWNTYVRVESADRAAADARAAGGAVVAEPFDAPRQGGWRSSPIPGAAFCVWEAGDREGAQLVNEPGAWSMSFLNVRDTDAAATFTASSSAGGPRPSSSAI